jgi:hypothetical protein
LNDGDSHSGIRQASKPPTSSTTLRV